MPDFPCLCHIPISLLLSQKELKRNKGDCMCSYQKKYIFCISAHILIPQEIKKLTENNNI